MRTLVLGTGRSGTRWVASVLEQLVPTGHEAVYDEGVALGEKPPWWGHHGNLIDVSWMAVPFVPLVGIECALVTRDPVATVRSLLATGIVAGDGTDAYSRVIARHRPEVFRHARAADRALVFWTSWNLAALQAASTWCRVEDCSVGDIADIAALAGVTPPPEEVAAAMASVPTDVNTRAPMFYAAEPLTFSAPVFESAAVLADLFGYRSLG